MRHGVMIGSAEIRLDGGSIVTDGVQHENRDTVLAGWVYVGWANPDPVVTRTYGSRSPAATAVSGCGWGCGHWRAWWFEGARAHQMFRTQTSTLRRRGGSSAHG